VAEVAAGKSLVAAAAQAHSGGSWQAICLVAEVAVVVAIGAGFPAVEVPEVASEALEAVVEAAAVQAAAGKRSQYSI
jgi:hypothetical protein